MSAELERTLESPTFARIVNAIKGGHCIPFFGAGASGPYHEWRNGCGLVKGCPTGGELRAKLEQTLQADPLTSKELGKLWLPDLPSLADYFSYYDNGLRSRMEDLIRQLIANAIEPRPIHSVIAAIPTIRCAFTTNYDQLFEQAVRRLSSTRRLVGPYIYRQNEHQQQQPKPEDSQIIDRQVGSSSTAVGSALSPLMLYKMHGCISVPDSLLITLSDYVAFLSSWHDMGRGMPKAFRDLFSKKIFLFLGYSLADTNFRVMWDAMIASFPNQRFTLNSYAVKTPVTEYERSRFERQGISLIDTDLTTFARALAEHFKVDIPEPPHGGSLGDNDSVSVP